MTTDFQHIQFGFEGIQEHQILSRAVPAAKVSCSGIPLVGDYWQANGIPKILRRSLKTPTLAQLANIYYGIQAHQLLFYLNVYLRLEQVAGRLKAQPPNSYCLWHKKPARLVWDYILQTTIAAVGHVRGVDRAVLRARMSLHLWQQFQNFYIDLPNANQRSFSESRLYKPGKREAQWHSTKLARQLEQLLDNTVAVASGLHRLDTCFVSDDALIETPVNLYIRANNAAALMCWVQPDQVNVYRDKIIVYDHKFENEPLDKARLDNFGRLQILLLALAGYTLTRQCLGRRRRQHFFDDMPCYRLTLEVIPALLSNVRVIYQQPNILANDSTFRQVEMTLTDNEVAGAVFDLGQVIHYLSDTSVRNGVYAYIAARKRAQEGVTPETMFLPTPTPVQPLLPL